MTHEDIARGLSEAEQEAFDWVRPCSLIAKYRKGGPSLLKLGLVEIDGYFYVITPLGLAVRAILERENG